MSPKSDPAGAAKVLTDEDIDKLGSMFLSRNAGVNLIRHFGRAIEAEVTRRLLQAMDEQPETKTP